MIVIMFNKIYLFFLVLPILSGVNNLKNKDLSFAIEDTTKKTIQIKILNLEEFSGLYKSNKNLLLKKEFNDKHIVLEAWDVERNILYKTQISRDITWFLTPKLINTTDKDVRLFKFLYFGLTVFVVLVFISMVLFPLMNLINYMQKAVRDVKLNIDDVARQIQQDSTIVLNNVEVSSEQLQTTMQSFSSTLCTTSRLVTNCSGVVLKMHTLLNGFDIKHQARSGVNAIQEGVKGLCCFRYSYDDSGEDDE